MSSALVLRQRNSVHMMTDACSYQAPSGILRAVNLSKCLAMPTLNAAVSSTGPSENSALFCMGLMKRFSSFDEIIEFGEEALPEMFEDLSERFRGNDAISSLYLIGWHERQGRPAAYSMELWTDDSSQLERVLENSPRKARERFKFKEELLAGTPLPGRDLLDAAGFVIHEDDERFVPEIDLLHIMEVQRHEEIEGAYWVGGAALLTSIDRRGITQRVVHRWTEDEIGKPIRPRPIDWKQWRRNHPVNGVPIGLSADDGLNRQQRRQHARAQRRAS